MFPAGFGEVSEHPIRKELHQQAAALIDWTIGFAGENVGPLSVLGMATWSLRNCVRHSHATCFMENCPCGHSMVSLILIRSTAENWKIAHYPTDGLHQLIRLMFHGVCLIQADSTHFFVTLLRPILAGWSEEASACRGQVWDVPDHELQRWTAGRRAVVVMDSMDMA